MTNMKRGMWFPAGTDSMRIERWLGGRKFEIAEKQWLDLTKDDTGYPDHDYVVIRAAVDLSEIAENELAAVVELNDISSQVESLKKEGYRQDSDLLIAEVWFEAHAINDSYVIGDLMTSEEADGYIKRICPKIA